MWELMEIVSIELIKDWIESSIWFNDSWLIEFEMAADLIWNGGFKSLKIRKS